MDDAAAAAAAAAATCSDTHRHSRRRRRRRPAAARLPAATLPAAAAALTWPQAVFDSRLAARLRRPSAPLLGPLTPLEAGTATDAAPQRARMA